MQPRQDTTGAADTVATDPGVTSYRAPSQPKPEAKVDLLENKGGEEERISAYISSGHPQTIRNYVKYV